MPPSDNGHHRMNKPPHLDAFVQTIGDVSLSRRVQIFYHKNPRSSSRQLNMGYLSWGKWMCFAENCDLWSILDSLNKAIHLSIILPCECFPQVDVMCVNTTAFIYIASSLQYLDTYSI